MAANGEFSREEFLDLKWQKAYCVRKLRETEEANPGFSAKDRRTWWDNTKMRHEILIQRLRDYPKWTPSELQVNTWAAEFVNGTKDATSEEELRMKKNADEMERRVSGQ